MVPHSKSIVIYRRNQAMFNMQHTKLSKYFRYNGLIYIALSQHVIALKTAVLMTSTDQHVRYLAVILDRRVGV